VPTRFGGVSAWLARSNSAVFLRSSDRGSEDAVVFSEIGGDGFFEHKGGSGGQVVHSERASHKNSVSE